MGKTSVVGILKDHFDTLRNVRDNKLKIQDFVVQVGVPLLMGVVVWFGEFKLGQIELAVSGISIVSGLLFAVVIFLFQLRISLPEDPDISRDDRALLDETMFNVLWAILWGLLLVFYLIVCGSFAWIETPATPKTSVDPDSGSKLPILLSSVAVVAGAHLVFVLAMCLKRIRRAYQRIAMRIP